MRTLALPVEHGAWAFWLEPALLGMLLAPSAAGVALVVAALAALLLQTPLSLALSDLRRGRHYRRTTLAWRWAAGYALALVACGASAIWLAPAATFLVSVALAAPLALGQLWFDAHGRAREALPETLGALAMGSLASAVVVAAGWPLAAALVPWLVLAARTAPTIAYVRARLRLERGERVPLAPVWLGHAAALAVVAGVVVATSASAWLLAPFALLAARAWVGLSPWRRPVGAKVVGFSELGYGVLTALAVALTLTL